MAEEQSVTPAVTPARKMFHATLDEAVARLKAAQTQEMFVYELEQIGAILDVAGQIVPSLVPRE